MKKHIALSLLLGGIAAQTITAQTYLSGITELSTTTAGAPFGGSRWNTHGGESVVNIFVSSGAGLANPFLNGPSDANTSISSPLSLGVNTFTFFAGSGGFNTNHAINLFFNGANSTARISAVAATKISGATPAFAANGSATTYAVDGFTVISAANSLNYLDGNRLITLTDYFWATPSVFNVDRITAPSGNPGQVGADGVMDWVGQITLTVTEVPEPSVTAVLLVGLAGVVRRLKK